MSMARTPALFACCANASAAAPLTALTAAARLPCRISRRDNPCWQPHSMPIFMTQPPEVFGYEISVVSRPYARPYGGMKMASSSGRWGNNLSKGAAFAIGRLAFPVSLARLRGLKLCQSFFFRLDLVQDNGALSRRLGLDFGDILEIELNARLKMLIHQTSQVRFGLLRVARPADDSKKDSVIGPVNHLEPFHFLALAAHHERQTPESRLNQTPVVGFEYFSKSSQDAFEHAQRTPAGADAWAEFRQIADAIPQKGHGRGVQLGNQNLSGAALSLVASRFFQFHNVIFLIYMQGSVRTQHGYVAHFAAAVEVGYRRLKDFGQQSFFMFVERRGPGNHQFRTARRNVLVGALDISGQAGQRGRGSP